MDVANKDDVMTCWLLRTPVMEALRPEMLEVVRERTFATVWPRGKAKVLMIFQVFSSLEETVRDA